MTLLNLLNKHCPAVKMRRRFGPLTPWFDAECRSSRRHSRMLERRYRRTRSNADCYGYFSSRKCTDYMRKRTISTGKPRLQTTRATQRIFGALYQASWENKTEIKWMTVCTLPKISASFSRTRSMQSEQRHPTCLCKMYQSLQSMPSIIEHWQRQNRSRT